MTRRLPATHAEHDQAAHAHDRHAHATGGHAVFDDNGIGEVAAHLMDVDRSYYTLTYSPQDFKKDNKYHKIRIELDNGSQYQLSYRPGISPMEAKAVLSIPPAGRSLARRR